MINKIALTVIVSVILTILIVALVNVGLSIFLIAPDYQDYCGDYRTIPMIKPVADDFQYNLTCTPDTKTCKDGTVLSKNPDFGCEFPSCSKEFKTCQEEYDDGMKDYNQIKYYIFAVVGFALLLFGLFSGFNMFQLTGLISGGVLLTEGVAINYKNKVIVFISLLIIFIIFGIAAWRIIENLGKKKRKKIF